MDDKTTMTLKLLKQLQDEMMCDAGKKFVPKAEEPKLDPEDTEVPAGAPKGDMDKDDSGLKAHLDKVAAESSEDPTTEDLEGLLEDDGEGVADVGPKSKASQRMAKRAAANKR